MWHKRQVSNRRGNAYRRQGNFGHDDGVHGARGGAEGLVLVAVRVVLVLVDLAILRDVVPGHGALANADVALGVDGGGLATEVPVISNPMRSADCIVESQGLVQFACSFLD